MTSSKMISSLAKTLTLTPLCGHVIKSWGDYKQCFSSLETVARLIHVKWLGTATHPLLTFFIFRTNILVKLWKCPRQRNVYMYPLRTREMIWFLFPLNMGPAHYTNRYKNIVILFTKDTWTKKIIVFRLRRNYYHKWARASTVCTVNRPCPLKSIIYDIKQLLD